MLFALELRDHWVMRCVIGQVRCVRQCQLRWDEDARFAELGGGDGELALLEHASQRRRGLEGRWMT